MMRSGGRWGRLEIHADTSRKIWGTHVAVLGVERGGVVQCKINTAAHRASQRRVVLRLLSFTQTVEKLCSLYIFVYSSSFSNSYSSGGGSTAGQMLVLLEQSSMSISWASLANSWRIVSSWSSTMFSQ